MISYDPNEAHKQGCSKAYQNAAKRFAPIAGVPATLPGLYPKENLERIARAVEHNDRVAGEQINLLVRPSKKQG